MEQKRDRMWIRSEPLVSARAIYRSQAFGKYRILRRVQASPTQSCLKNKLFNVPPRISPADHKLYPPFRTLLPPVHPPSSDTPNPFAPRIPVVSGQFFLTRCKSIAVVPDGAQSWRCRIHDYELRTTNYGLLQHLLQRWLHRIRPELITMFIRMQEIRHDVGVNLAVVAQENFVDVQESESLAIIELGEVRIDLMNGLQLLRSVSRFVARENGQQQDFRLRTFLAHIADNLFHAFGDLVRRIRIAVVRPNHQHDDFGIQSVQFAMFDAPDDVLRPVAADAEIRRVPRAVGFLPNILAPAAPIVRDGIAHEQNLNAARLGLFHKSLMPRHPIRWIAARHGSDGGIFDHLLQIRFLGQAGRCEENREEERKDFLHARNNNRTVCREQDNALVAADVRRQIEKPTKQNHQLVNRQSQIINLRQPALTFQRLESKNRTKLKPLC